MCPNQKAFSIKKKMYNGTNGNVHLVALPMEMSWNLSVALYGAQRDVCMVVSKQQAPDLMLNVMYG